MHTPRSLLRTFVATLLAALVVGCATIPSDAPPAAGIKPHALFSHNMVLQRDAETTVWGKAEPGGVVTVALDAKMRRALVGQDGAWGVRLAAREAGGPHTLTIAGVDSLTFTNVVFGDVWVCSGQSNMGFPLRRAENAAICSSESTSPGFTTASRKP